MLCTMKKNVDTKRDKVKNKKVKKWKKINMDP